MLKDWRALPENERNRIAAKVSAAAIAYRGDAIPDERLQHLSAAAARQTQKPPK